MQSIIPSSSDTTAATPAASEKPTFGGLDLSMLDDDFEIEYEVDEEAVDEVAENAHVATIAEQLLDPDNYDFSAGLKKNMNLNMKKGITRNREESSSKQLVKGRPSKMRGVGKATATPHTEPFPDALLQHH